MNKEVSNVSSRLASLLPYRVTSLLRCREKRRLAAALQKKKGSSKEEPADKSCRLILLFDGFLHHGELQFGLGQ